MSIYETNITNPKKQLEFYKDLSKELQKENEELKKIINKTITILVNIDGDLPYSKESDKICDLIDTLRLVK